MKTLIRMAAVLAASLLGTACSRPAATSAPRELRVGIVQLGVQTTLRENLSKIVAFIDQAKARGCRLVVFPESSLSGEAVDPAGEMARAVSAIARAADAADVYVMFGGKSEPGPVNWMRVIGPDGREIFQYDKLWDRPTAPMPGVFSIDGIACSAVICADRWLRGVEELPVMQGARISFELSDNFANEWVPELGWYWYVPRALRNGTYVVFANTGVGRDRQGDAHGHSAVIAPDGRVVAAARGSSEELVVTSVAVDEASRAEALERRGHPVLGPFWEAGVKMMEGGAGDPVASPSPPPAAALEVAVAAVQMASSRELARNLAAMKAHIAKAAGAGADVVVFPELALTGALDEDVAAARPAELDEAIQAIREAARGARVHVIFGAPYVAGGKRRNSAFVVGADGAVLTRYDQLAVDRTDLFAAGDNAGSMWFRVKGVPAIVTVGKDALWSEIAEMAAAAGAAMVFNLAYDRSTGEAAALRRLQLGANLASFQTLTVMVNAASPDGVASPSAPAGGGSAIWEDLRSAEERSRKADDAELGKGVCLYSKYSANCVVKAGTKEEVLHARRTVSLRNDYAASRIKKNPRMAPWYRLGASLILGKHEPGSLR